MRFLQRQYRGGKTTQQVVMIGVGMELLLGALAGALAQIFTIPVSVVTTRQQTSVVEISDPNLSSGKKERKASLTLLIIVVF
jgi:hypothetical protein